MLTLDCQQEGCLNTFQFDQKKMRAHHLPTLCMKHRNKNYKKKHIKKKKEMARQNWVCL